MTPYIYMLINAIAAFWLHQSSENFRGSAVLIKTTLTIASAIGFLNLLVFTVYAITQLVWWQPIVAILVVGAISPIATSIFNLLPHFIVDILMFSALIICLIFMYGTI